MGLEHFRSFVLKGVNSLVIRGVVELGELGEGNDSVKCQVKLRIFVYLF